MPIFDDQIKIISEFNSYFIDLLFLLTINPITPATTITPIKIGIIILFAVEGVELLA
jgi:hypothetical protein